MSAKRTVKNLSFRAFLALDRVGVHLLPKHYYTPVADRAWLRSHPDLWQRAVPLDRLTHWDLDEQAQWVENICAPYQREVQGESGEDIGPGYGPIEAQILYCFMRAYAPARVVEIGGGTSTAIMTRATDRNAREGRVAAEITVIEPYPAHELAALSRVELVRAGCQELAASFVAERLRAGDLLFIDSSHAVKTGSEVSFLYLWVIPSLPPGVIVHVHDVFLPYLYRPTVLNDYFDWQETALLCALLAGNDGLRILCSGSALHYERTSRLKAVLPDYRPASVERGLIDSTEFTGGHFPAILWLETRGKEPQVPAGSRRHASV